MNAAQEQVDRSSVRIVHISSAHRASDPRIFEKECCSIAAAGYDVALIATGDAPIAGFRVISLPRSDRRLERMTLGAARAVFRALRLRPALVHLHDPELVPWIPLFRLLGIRVVFDSHEDITATGQKAYIRGPIAPLAHFAGRVLVWMIEHFATGVVAATPQITNMFKNSRTATVQNFPVLDDWSPDDTAERPCAALAYVGWVTEARGAWQMLEAIEILGETRSARLQIAGWVAEPLLQQLQQHPGWKYVDFHGALDRRGVDHLLRSSTVGLVLFLPSPNHVASQPTKMFEYMAAGLPVLASDYPHWRELVLREDAGVVVNPLDVEAIVAACEELIDGVDSAVRMGRRGRAVVERDRNWDNEAKQLVGLYDSIFAR